MELTVKELLELEPTPIKILDLKPYMQIASEGKYKIGVIKEDIKEGFTIFKKGQFILFRPYLAKEVINNMLWDDIKKHCKLCTTCQPYIDKNGTVQTASCCVGVPLSLIEYEITI